MAKSIRRVKLMVTLVNWSEITAVQEPLSQETAGAVQPGDLKAPFIRRRLGLNPGEGTIIRIAVMMRRFVS